MAQVMDGISYEVVWGYRTAFAYLFEAAKGNLRDPEGALAEALTLRVPCGQFSYANIKPARVRRAYSCACAGVDQTEVKDWGKYGGKP